MSTTCHSIHIVIFSFNRAMQLNTLIESVFEHFKYPFKISVLYNHTLSHCNGYNLLIKKYTDVEFIKEENVFDGYKVSELSVIFNIKRYIKYPYIRKPKSNFRRKLIEILDKSNSQFVMFLTDDSLFINSPDINPHILKQISFHPADTQYSLRLGRDINKPVSYTEKDGYISWNFYDTANTRDWIYHFSVDAHIYDRKFILDLARDIIFSNPNSYEAFTREHIFRNGYQRQGYANIEPSILSFPINMVQNVQNNESLSVSTELLEKYFLEGYVLRYIIPENINTFQYYPDNLLLEKDGLITRLSTSLSSPSEPSRP